MENMRERKEQLEGIKVRELQKMATALGIKNSRALKKAECIETILRAEKSAEESKSAIDKSKIDNVSNVVVVDKSEKKTADVDCEQKMQYIESARIGTLVAFRLPNGKVKSAKIVKRSTQNRRFCVETSYGAQAIVSFDDIIWVRTGKRWPRGVFNLLKGGVSDGSGC